MERSVEEQKYNRKYVKMRLRDLRFIYSYYKTLSENIDNSRGMIARYESTGGGSSGFTSDYTARAAMLLASAEPSKVLDLKWVMCVEKVYKRGIKPYINDNNENLWSKSRRSSVSFLIYYKVFHGYTFDRILDLYYKLKGKTMSRRRIYEIWDNTLDDIIIQAYEDGLL